MHKKFFIITMIFVFILFRPENIFGQEVPDIDPEIFMQLQLDLAGDPSIWQDRSSAEDGNVVVGEIKPHWVYFEEEAYHHPDEKVFNTDPEFEHPIDKEIWEEVNEMFDADSAIGEEKRLSIDRFSPRDDHFFDPRGDYIIETTEITEIGKIKSIFTELTSTITRSGVPERGESAAWCLSEGIGVCRHMAPILQESFEEVGIKSTLQRSPTHVWVRVTLTEGKYNGITIDLDPMWYQQPIPLPPRSTIPLSPEWKKLVSKINELELNQTPSVSGTPSPTPSTSVTPTFTPTPTPTFTPTPTMEPEPTSPGGEENSDEGSYNYNNSSGTSDDDSNGCGVLCVQSR